MLYTECPDVTERATLKLHTLVISFCMPSYRSAHLLPACPCRGRHSRTCSARWFGICFLCAGCPSWCNPSIIYIGSGQASGWSLVGEAIPARVWIQSCLLYPSLMFYTDTPATLSLRHDLIPAKTIICLLITWRFADPWDQAGATEQLLTHAIKFVYFCGVRSGGEFRSELSCSLCLTRLDAQDVSAALHR